ncbi:MAG: NAD(P)/FAD-dependent oxidoreductase, partial [bacterium]
PEIQSTQENPRLLDVCGHRLVEFRCETTVWDFPAPRTLAWVSGTGNGRLNTRTLILATGAYDRPAPFEGWTLPGVISAGGMVNLYKSQRVVAGSRVVVAGNGPLLLTAAQCLFQAGAEVLALVEAAPFATQVIPQFPGLMTQPGLLGKGMSYRYGLWYRSVPVLEQQVVTRARGDHWIENIEVRPLDDKGKICRERCVEFDVDALVTGYGLMPSLELTRLAGCRHSFHSPGDTWVPERSTDLETSVPGVYVVGDGAGVAGYKNAMVEGRIAALAILNREEPSSRVSTALKVAIRRRCRRQRFSQALSNCYRTPLDYSALVTPDTVICRCENVLLSEIRPMLTDKGSVPSLARVKSETRAGMGRCGGRNCIPSLVRLLSSTTGQSSETIALPRTRPPARPIRIGDLFSEALPDPDLPADPHSPRGVKDR